MYTVYKHTTPSGKVYIGITGRAVEKRWENGSGYKSNKYFYSAIKKYGWDNIKHEIVCTGLSKWQVPTCAVGRQKHLVDTIGNMFKSRGDYDEQVQR